LPLWPGPPTSRSGAAPCWEVLASCTRTPIVDSSAFSSRFAGAARAAPPRRSEGPLATRALGSALPSTGFGAFLTVRRSETRNGPRMPFFRGETRMICSRRVLLAAALVAAGSGLVSCKRNNASAEGGAAARSDNGEIVIGHYASMTGGTAHFGQDTDKALRLAIDQANREGGVKGRKLRVVTLDTRGDSAEAANAVSRLIDVEKATAIVG